MNAGIIEGYVEKVYGYATRRTRSSDEADELAQEILFVAVRELPKLRDPERFEPWLWGVAGNVTKTFRRRAGKQRAMFSYDIPEDMPGIRDDTEEDGEIYSFLREKIAMLSSIYRDIIILHYYDGLPVKEIAKKLGIPEGTVSWRLSVARSKLKKECEDMNESALRPVKMKIGIYGSGNYDGKTIPFPDEYVSDSLSQNILYHCYDEQKNAEELAKLCGVPAYYIEERLENLERRGAVTSPAKGKFRTDFIIWSDKYGKYCEVSAGPALAPLIDRLIDAILGVSSDALSIGFYRAGKSEEELTYLCGALAFRYARRHCKLPYPDIPPNYDGNRWRYVADMENGRHKRIGVGIQHSANLGSRGSYSHTTYRFGGFGFRKMMPDNYINVCEDLLTAGKTGDENSAALAIRGGYIVRREDGELFVTTPALNKAEAARFDEIADSRLSPLMEEYSEIVNRFSEGYRKLFPKHLEDDARRMSQSIFFGLYDYIVSYGQKTGRFTKPAPGGVCDVLIQFK